MLKFLPLKGLLLILQMLGHFFWRLPIAIIGCEMVLDKQGKELMGSAHLGMHKVSLSSLLRRETHCLMMKLFSGHLKGRLEKKPAFLQQPVLSM